MMGAGKAGKTNGFGGMMMGAKSAGKTQGFGGMMMGAKSAGKTKGLGGIMTGPMQGKGGMRKGDAARNHPYSTGPMVSPQQWAQQQHQQQQHKEAAMTTILKGLRQLADA